MTADPYRILGVASDATDEEIKKAYRALSKKYHPDANLDNPELAEQKFKEVQEAYRALASMTEGKDYFIVTTAKDARIFESSLDEAKITAPCGNVNWLQCSKGCTKDIWERGEVADGICPHCGAPLTENTVLANPYIEEGYLKSWNLYREWLAGTLNHALLILELGVDFKTPTVIRWPFEKTVFFNRKSHMYRINQKFYQIVGDIQERTVSIPQNSVGFIRNFASCD